MLKSEKGMTLVEVLATLLLMTLVTGVIWSTISIATKFNVAETTTLRLQKEANYIISKIQQVHRNCDQYKLIINTDEVKIAGCVDENEESVSGYDGVISNRFNYLPIMEDDEYNTEQTPTTKDLDLTGFAVIDPANSNRIVKVPTTISRFIIDESEGGSQTDEISEE